MTDPQQKPNTGVGKKDENPPAQVWGLNIPGARFHSDSGAGFSIPKRQGIWP
jgi:hypothetical protein